MYYCEIIKITRKKSFEKKILTGTVDQLGTRKIEREVWGGRVDAELQRRDYEWENSVFSVHMCDLLFHDIKVQLVLVSHSYSDYALSNSLTRTVIICSI